MSRAEIEAGLASMDAGMKDGDVWIRAKDPACGTPGPDEAQKF
jgi:hypothetical protein